MNDLTADRRDALQEMINIGFGRSVAALADLLRVFIDLSVPDIQLVEASHLLDLLFEGLEVQDEVSLIKQSFRGDFFGEAVLALPGKSGQEVVRALTQEAGFNPEMEIGQLEMEALLEVGNVVIGACLGQFADLLGRSLSYNPPAFAVESTRYHQYLGQLTTRPGEVLLIRTNFRVNENDISGFLLIFLHKDCLAWLFSEVDRFLEGAFA